MDADFPWPSPLSHKKGAPYNLRGIDVFYDFAWNDHFRDGRVHFRNGMCLAEQALEACPAGKTAALLLTKLEDKEGSFESDTFFVLVINFPQYLRLADANAAVSYLARSLGSGITNASHLSELSHRTPEELKSLLEQELTADKVGEWAAGNARRLRDLREALDFENSSTGLRPNQIAAAIKDLETLDSEVVLALRSHLPEGIDQKARLELISDLTSTSQGRRETGESLGKRANQRLADARIAIGEYSALLENEDSNETTFQHFIEGNLWLLGLDYIQIRPRHDIPRGTLDFILERFDGFHDLLELKDPHDPIIEAPDPEDARPPSASSYKLSPALSNALAQVHVYRDILTTNDQLLDEQYGLPQSRDPRIVIVIGRGSNLSAHRERVLRELNKSLHCVEVVPYDLLGRRAEAILRSIEENWSAAESV